MKSKTSLNLGQIDNEILCWRSINLKIGQKVCLDEISDDFKFDSPRVKN